MTHSHDNRAGPAARNKVERMAVLGLGATLAVSGALSFVYLVDQYNKAAPYRDARAAQQAQEREAREAEEAERKAADALRDAEGRLPPPVTVMVDPAPPGGGAVAQGFRLEDLPPEQRREIERMMEQRGGRPIYTPQPAQPARPPASRSIRWYIPPSWPSVRNDAFPEGVSRMGVQFSCRVTSDGVLTGCTSVEEPAGTGLAARMRPALDRARVDPPTAGGRPVASDISFGVSFTAAPRRVVAPPPPAPPAEAEKPPVYMPPSALPSADRLNAAPGQQANPNPAG